MKSYSFTHLRQRWTLFQRAPGGPWYFAPRWGKRKQKKFHCFRDTATKAALDRDAALAGARQLIDAHHAGPDSYEKLREQTKLRGTLTVGAVLEKWIAGGCPLPRNEARTSAEAQRHLELVKFMRDWFADKNVALVNEPMLGQYAAWRRTKLRVGFSGARIIDRELNSLSQCFRWALSVGEAEANPFRKRERFQMSSAVKHAPEYMPASDDELHRLLGWLIATREPANILAAAHLGFMALTGLRSGEPGFLRWGARYLDNGPEPGHRFTRTLDGAATELLAIRRLKGGINPAVTVRPALAAFLDAWKPYCRTTWPASDFWFPHPQKTDRPLVLPEDPSDPLNSRLQTAAKALGLPHRKAHAMRAFYVRVRRSQGASDAAIAEELGQGSGPSLIVTTYGAADQIRGDGRFDWLPSDAVPLAWSLFTPTASNLIAL